MIDGVKILELETHRDKRGFFREIFRFSENFPDIPVGQISHSKVHEGVVKGWHGHVYQYQWNYVLSGIAKIVLKDFRKDSNTFDVKMFIEAGKGKKTLGYFFPPGVLHGYKCIEGPMNIIYTTSGVYDEKQDELRMDFNEIL